MRLQSGYKTKAKYGLKDLPPPVEVGLFASSEGPSINSAIIGTNIIKLAGEPRRHKLILGAIHDLIAPLPHAIRQKLMRDYHECEGKSGLDAANAELALTLKRLLMVWNQYPFHHIPQLNAVRGDSTKQADGADEYDTDDIRPALPIVTPRLRQQVTELSFVDLILGKQDSPGKFDGSNPDGKVSPFRGYELLRQRKSKKFKAAADSIADYVMQAVKQAAQNAKNSAHLEAYEAAAKLTQMWGAIPPYWGAVMCDLQLEVAMHDLQLEAAECGILRMTCSKWWGRQLSRMRDMCCEHMNIAAGLVTNHRPYVSDEAFNEWLSQQKSAQNWLENTVIENDEGFILPLIEAAMAGNANPSNRLVELIVRARGVEELAQDAGMDGYMVTLTCPSKFHKHSAKWDGASPKTAQQYLVKQFAKIRSALKYREIKMTGIRVAEPHKDGTPHWHMCCFVAPAHVETFKAILRKYAFEVDGHEPGAAEHRLKIDPIDRKRGSAVGYVIKYLSKNIQGEFMQGELMLDHLDGDAGADVSEAAPWCRAWASRHRLRQFQFYGTSSVQIWRELRRIKVGPQSPEIESAKSAACSSDWFAFEKAMQQARIRLSYDITEQGNAYGEAVRRVQGVDGIAFGKKRTLITRGERWKLRGADDAEQEAYQLLKRKRNELFKLQQDLPEDKKMSRKELKAAMPKWSLSLFKEASGLPWTCRNNCTDPNPEAVDNRVIRHLAQVGIRDVAAIDRMIYEGVTLMGPDGDEWWIERGELRYREGRYSGIMHVPLAQLVSKMRDVPANEIRSLQ